MHEFSLIANLLQKIDELANKEQAGRVVGVKVKLGALAHISADHFRGHFVHGTIGTKAEGARLDVEVSLNTNDPNAQDILLDSIEVE